jgi:SMI1-KNR4 cell-wall
MGRNGSDIPMWRELIQAISPGCTFEPPASEAVLAEVEEALGVVPPPELRALWLESNGIHKRSGEGIWSAERVIQENLEFRSYPDQNDLYMPFDPLFFFAWVGNGDLFFYPVQAGGIHRDDVFLWDHETDSRVWVANNLQQFVQQWFSGKLRC